MAGGGFVIKAQACPQAQCFHVLPEGVGAAVVEFQLGGVHHRVVEAVVEQHIAQVMHIKQARRFAADALFGEQAAQVLQAVDAEMGEKQQAVGLQRVRPVVEHLGRLFGQNQAEIRPQHIAASLRQRSFQRLPVLGDGFTGQFGQ